MVKLDLDLALICPQQPKLLPKFGMFKPDNLWGKISPMKLQMVKRFPSSRLPLSPLMSFPLLCISGFLVQTSKADSIDTLRIPSGRWTPFLANLLRLPPTPHTFPSPHTPGSTIYPPQLLSLPSPWSSSPLCLLAKLLAHWSLFLLRERSDWDLWPLPSWELPKSCLEQEDTFGSYGCWWFSIILGVPQ